MWLSYSVRPEHQWKRRVDDVGISTGYYENVIHRQYINDDTMSERINHGKIIQPCLDAKWNLVPNYDVMDTTITLTPVNTSTATDSHHGLNLNNPRRTG